MDEADARVGHPQPVGEDLREGRLVALADMLRAGNQRDRAVGFEAHVDILVGRPAGRLDVIGEAQPAQPSVLRALAPPRLEARAVGTNQRLVERFGEAAAVDFEAEGVGHRHCLGRHHVPAPEVGAIEACLARRRIDQPLDDVDRLGEARSARDADRRGVGDDRHNVKGDRRDAVHRALEMDVLEGLHAAAGAGHVGAEIGDACDLQREEFALRVECQRRLGPHVARGMIGQEHLAAARDPLDRPGDRAGGPQDQGVLDIGEVLGAEAAAHVGRHEPHVLRLGPERAGHVVAVDVDVLAGDVERIAAGRGIERAHAAARLHRVHHDAMVVEVERHDMRRGGEGGLGAAHVPGPPVEAGIARDLVGELRRARGSGRLCRGHGRQRLIVHDHQLGGIQRLRVRLGHDQRHGLAGEANLVRGQQRLGCEGEGLAGLHVRLGIGAKRLQPVGGGLGGREDGEDARRRPGRGGVDRPNERMGMRRAQHDGMGQPLELEVVEIGALAGDEARVLAPPG